MREKVNWKNRIQKYSKSRFFFPIISSLAAADLFVAFIPTDMMLITAAYFRPKSRYFAALWVTAGAAIGAFLLAWVVSKFGRDFFTNTLGIDDHSTSWARAERIIADYGFWGIAFIALGPLPQQPIIAAASLMHLSPIKISIAVFVGRMPKYLFYSWAAVKAPHWVKLKQNL